MTPLTIAISRACAHAAQLEKESSVALQQAMVVRQIEPRELAAMRDALRHAQAAIDNLQLAATITTGDHLDTSAAGAAL